MEEKIENNSEENMRNLEEFIAHIAKQDEPSSEWKPLIKALWWVRKGDWDKAHDLAQEVDCPDGWQETVKYPTMTFYSWLKHYLKFNIDYDALDRVYNMFDISTHEYRSSLL